MMRRKLEVLQELDLPFLNALTKGDNFTVKASNKPSAEVVQFEEYNDAYITFKIDGELYGIFFQEIREGKVNISPG